MRTYTSLVALIAALALASLAGCKAPQPAGTPPPTPTAKAPATPAGADAKAPAGGGEIAWETDYAGALEKAKSGNKPVMIDLYADWCGPCRQLDTDTWSDAKVKALAAEFVCVKVDVDKDGATAEKYEANAIPLVVFLKPDGSEVTRSVGFKGPADMLKQMEEAKG